MHNVFNDIYRSIFPNGKYLTYGKGSSNVLLSAPHGGAMKPFHIPRRKYGQRGKDTYTRRLVERINSNNVLSPFYVYSDIHRSRVDLNRGIVEGAQNDYFAKGIWKDWNGLLELYTRAITKEYSRGLYIDIHSHNDGDYFELGYNLSAKSYRHLSYNGWTDSKSTLDSLGDDTYEMVFGRKSFKSSLESYGFSTLFPTGNEVYFNGGRNIEVYNGKGIGAIQIECPVSVLETDLQAVANAITQAIEIFRKEFIG